MTDTLEAAYAERIATLRSLGIPLPPGVEPDPLADPATWLQQSEAEAAEAAMDELIAAESSTEPPPLDLVAESDRWLGEAESDRRWH